MILTPKMYVLNEQIKNLEAIYARDPSDYMIYFDLQELRIKYSLLERQRKLGLQVIDNPYYEDN